ncbi:MAG: uroporphyrinogen decarboxylase family protein, partial [Planctomycetota bacterium]|nr:uroporphyrinogen decarboxylase family protein [Planctomycetota bacterium]
MTGRERVLATLNRQTPDYIPYDLAGTDCSAVHAISYKKLRDKLGILPDKPVDCGCLIQLIAQPEHEVMDRLETDAECLWFASKETKIWNTPFGVDMVVPKNYFVEDLPDGTSVVKNAAGEVWGVRAAGAYYIDPVGTPLAGITSAADLDQFDALFERWDYSAAYDEPLDDLAARARLQYEFTDRAVVALWRFHYLQSGQVMRGFEQFLVDLMVDPEMARALLDKLHQVYLRRVDTFLTAFGDYIDVVFLTDDLGTQQSGIISPKTYREMIYPHIAELVGRIKAAGKKVVMHSCGAVSDYIPSLIEMGVDALNPVQVSASGMNPRDLAREYGRDIAFWGGGCDTQHALNSPDTEVVRADVRRRVEE